MASENQSIDRRNFLKAAGGAAAAVSLAGCTGGGGEETTTEATSSGDSTTGDTTDGQGGQSEESSVLTYARGNDSGTLDPQNTTSGEDAKVTNQLYDTLIDFKPGETSLQAGLATDWNVDGTTVSLTLREGVTFHNGEQFTADDFVATYRRFVDEEYEHFPGADYASAYGPYALGNFIETAEKGGNDHELKLTLKSEYAPILPNLAMFCSTVHSKKAIEELGTDLKDNPVGTGAFKFENWDKGNQRIRLVKNDDYWGETAKVDEVVFTTIGQNSSRAQTLDTGDADIIDGLGAQSSQQVKQSSNATLESMPGINVGYMAFNMAKVEAFRKKKVRQAISYAINTKAIVDAIFKGIASQASQPIPDSVMGYNEDLDPYPHDPEKATQLLKEAGEEGLSFELATFKNPRTYNPSPIQAAETVRSNLQEVGVTVEINQQPFNPFLEYTSSGKHDACFLGWMTDNGDPDNFYYALLHPGVSREDVPEGQDYVSFDAEGFNTLDVAAWANTEFMKLVEEAQSTYDESKREENYKRAGKIAHDEAPWVFMDHAKELRGVHNRVKGFVLAPISGPYLNLVSLDE